MNLELTPEQLALRATVRRFLAERAGIADHVRPLLDDPAGTTPGVWSGLAGLGTTGLLVPERYGGTGMGMVEAGVVLEELGAALHPGPWLSTAVTAVRAITRAGTGSAEAHRLLTGIAEGSAVVTVGPLPARDEPLRVVERPGGTALSGRIDLLPDAAAATVLLVPDTGGLFAVDLRAAGTSLLPVPGIDGTRKYFRCDLDGAPARRVGAMSRQLGQALVDDVLVAHAADAVGAARALVELTLAHAKARHQFGQPIGAFQAVAHLCVGMYETLELARGLTLRALWAADCAGPDERHLAALRVKAYAGRLAAVGDTAVQVFGGVGYTWDSDVHLYLKRLLSWSTLFGAPAGYLGQLGSDLVRSVVPRTAQRCGDRDGR